MESQPSPALYVPNSVELIKVKYRKYSEYKFKYKYKYVLMKSQPSSIPNSTDLKLDDGDDNDDDQDHQDDNEDEE